MLRAGAQRYAVDRPALGVLASAVAGLPAATASVGARLACGLVGPVAGERIEHIFVCGPRFAPRAAGRRAGVVLSASLAPDIYVLRMPRDADKILYHAVTGRWPGHDPRWPS